MKKKKKKKYHFFPCWLLNDLIEYFVIRKISKKIFYSNLVNKILKKN